jgi:hypothetical protein
VSLLDIARKIGRRQNPPASWNKIVELAHSDEFHERVAALDQARLQLVLELGRRRIRVRKGEVWPAMKA